MDVWEELFHELGDHAKLLWEYLQRFFLLQQKQPQMTIIIQVTARFGCR